MWILNRICNKGIKLGKKLGRLDILIQQKLILRIVKKKILLINNNIIEINYNRTLEINFKYK